MMSLKHPTYFTSGYTDGDITLGGTGAVPMTCTINFENISSGGHLIELFSTTLYDSPQFEAALDMILYRLLLFLKEVRQDDMDCTTLLQLQQVRRTDVTLLDNTP